MTSAVLTPAERRALRLRTSGFIAAILLVGAFLTTWVGVASGWGPDQWAAAAFLMIPVAFAVLLDALRSAVERRAGAQSRRP